jgi:hypothetical protein
MVRPFGWFVFCCLLLGLTASGSAQPWLPVNAAVLGRRVPPGYWGLSRSVNAPVTVVRRTPSRFVAFPYAPGFAVPYGYNFFPWRYGSALHGAASLTAATGQYWRDIGEARLLREQARQASLETARQRVEFERWYESTRPTAPQLMDARREADLHRARYHAQNTEIWSGRPLNVLLRSILTFPQPTSGPYIPLDQETVRRLNLTDGTTRANLALAREEGRIAWTEALQEEAFDSVRDEFSKNFANAMKLVGKGETPPLSLIRALRAELATISAKLDDAVQELPPSRFIESRRLLTQLDRTIQGLSNPRLVKAANDPWWKNIHTVADLVTHCKRNGLEFGPAVAPGDHQAYLAAFHALREYERGIQQLAGHYGPRLAS